MVLKAREMVCCCRPYDDLYFITCDDKKTYLKLKEMPEDGELFDSYVNKKQPETAKSSDCLHLAGPTLFKLNY